MFYYTFAELHIKGLVGWHAELGSAEDKQAVQPSSEILDLFGAVAACRSNSRRQQ